MKQWLPNVSRSVFPDCPPATNSHLHLIYNSTTSCSSTSPMSFSPESEILVCASCYVLAALLYQRYPSSFSRLALTAAVGYFMIWAFYCHEFTFQRVELAVKRRD
jgi:hypothetical protein